MAYCQQEDVQAEFKSLALKSTASVTPDTIDRFIAESDAEIDARLSGVYAVPITGTSSLIIMRTISIWLTAGRVRDILHIKTGNEDDRKDEGPDYCAKAYAMIKDIVSQDLSLNDATLKQSGGITSYNSANGVEAIFDKDTEQW